MVSNSADKGNIIYIVEDDDQLRDWLALGLNARGFEARGYASIQDFQDALDYLRPGCVLADLRIPGGGAIELLERLTPRWMEFPVIVMTAYSDVSVAVAAMKGGAFDFIEKPFTEDSVVALIRSVQKRVDSALHQRRQSAAFGDIARKRLELLTTREREVMDYLVQGHPNKVIAGYLGLSTRTVEVYRANVLKKMQVRSLAQLASMTFAASADTADHHANESTAEQK